MPASEEQHIETEIRSLGMKLLTARPTRAMIDAFDCMVGEFYGQEKVDRDLFFWAQAIVGRVQ